MGSKYVCIALLQLSHGFNVFIPFTKPASETYPSHPKEYKEKYTRLGSSSSTAIRFSVSSYTREDARRPFQNESFTLLGKVDKILESEMKFMKWNQQEILNKVDASHAVDLEFCVSLGNEHSSRTRIVTIRPPEYEWVYVNEGKEEVPSRPLAIRTTQQPVLDDASISIIRKAAESWWENDKIEDAGLESGVILKPTKSRFTYQRPGNYEAHLVDLAAHVDSRIQTVAKKALENKIYPLVRDAFTSLIPDMEDFDLCVYDSLVIRYNSTEAMMASKNNSHAASSGGKFLGAGQPLHRDQALISVNIMLNSENEFEGGGTFFENQMRAEILNDGFGEGGAPEPLKPIGAGHAVAHLSSERHAGVGTISGVRDILVLFLTGNKRSASNQISNNDLIKRAPIPCMERASRLKSAARQDCVNCVNAVESILCRMLYHRLSILHDPLGGESWHYLGMAFYSKVKTSNPSTAVAIDMIRLSISCLEYALKLMPCDGRLCNNLGLTYESLASFDRKSNYGPLIEKYYKQSIQIHQLSEMVGCDVRSDFESVALNYGLYISYLDEFDRAAKILDRFRIIRKDAKDEKEEKIIHDGSRLLTFCKSQI